MKNILLTFALFVYLLPRSYSMVVDCYSDWHTAFEIALNDYNANGDKCNGAIYYNLECDMANEAAYTKAVTAAGNKYYDCMGFN